MEIVTLKRIKSLCGTAYLGGCSLLQEAVTQEKLVCPRETLVDFKLHNKACSIIHEVYATLLFALSAHMCTFMFAMSPFHLHIYDA